MTKLYNSLAEATEKLQSKNGSLQDTITDLTTRLMGCQQALDINKEIMHNALTEQNMIKETYSAEITKLKEKIKGFESGIIN
jgi:hypothetical protein